MHIFEVNWFRYVFVSHLHSLMLFFVCVCCCWIEERLKAIGIIHMEKGNAIFSTHIIRRKVFGFDKSAIIFFNGLMLSCPSSLPYIEWLMCVESQSCGRCAQTSTNWIPCHRMEIRFYGTIGHAFKCFRCFCGFSPDFCFLFHLIRHFAFHFEFTMSRMNSP